MKWTDRLLCIVLALAAVAMDLPSIRSFHARAFDWNNSGAAAMPLDGRHASRSTL